MILSSVRVIRTRDTGEALRFTATLQQVRIAATTTIRLPASILTGDTAKNSGESKVDKGKLSQTTPTEATSNNGSIAYNAVYGGG